jgi:hypothetical protein
MKKGIGPRGLGAPKSAAKMYGAKSPAKQTDYQKKERERISKMGPQVDETPEGRGKKTRTVDKVKSAIQAPFSEKTYGDLKKDYRGEQKNKHKEQVQKRRDWANYWISRY